MVILDASRSNSATVFVSRRLGMDISPRYRALAAYDDYGKVLGVIAFNDWSENSAQVHMCIETPLCAAQLFKASVRYFFGLLGMGVAIAMPLVGSASHRLALAVGFKELARVRDGFRPGIDLALLELRSEDCHYFQRVKESRMLAHG